MDYFGILKRAWQITWKYKALWLLGFFALSGGSSGSGGGSGYRFDGSDPSGGWDAAPFAREAERLMDWFADNVALLIVIGAFLALISLVFFVLSIAARGGLVHLVNEAEEGRPVSLPSGWSVGFRHWGRTFMVGLVAMLPFVLVVVGLVAFLLVFVIATVAGTGAAGELRGLGAGEDLTGLIAGGGAFLCCGIPLFVIALAVLGVVLGIVMELGIRYGVLYDMTFGKALAQGWRDVWAKRGAVVMWLVLLLPGLAYGAVVGVIALVGLVPALLAVRDGSLTPLLVTIGVMMLVLIVPNAVYGTFMSASWTVFFRRMTGLEPAASPQRVPYPASGGYVPPAPPAQPPAPPAPPVASPVAPPSVADLPAPEPPVQPTSDA